MAIARKPGGKPDRSPEAAAERFISAAGAPQPATAAAAPQADGGGRRRPAMIRFAPDLLVRVDRAARRRGVSRSAWIQYTLSKALDEEEAPG
jgi:hypothetical protein